MSDEEFLARWSRLKRETKSGNDALPPAEPTPAPSPAPPSNAAEDPGASEVDLSNLPPIDSIDAGTDITAFLRKGIPQELSRAALRRAWTADPAIRDFIGLAENAWDFNDPNAMPGFGPLDCSEAELRGLVDRIVGGVRKAAEALTDPVGEVKEVGRLASSGRNPAEEPNPTEVIGAPNTAEESTPAEPATSSAASQPSTAEASDSEDPPIRRRTHGGARPR
ncbi:DUF3306 domain-containing protein [Bradyrhizobium australiense]|uniref:DUF3306 domain-containing protein n=1 Tax=Bradyrhizobium australiense TaxID=2721161 RepID=A0A7Y4GPF1_9BRAD|nr:DUF3306 domain-containing protein [Bradyrhizobium australiense]NOJ39319.1 DUF3306 domain-containing protein [Bradyrhizobium australiense]